MDAYRRGFAVGGTEVGFLCIEGNCKQGEALVTQMRETFALLYGELDGEKREAFKARFAAPVAALLKSFNDENGKFSRKLPFSPVCCTIGEIGQQAAKMTSAMLASTGKEPIAAPSVSMTAGLGKTALGIAAIAALAYAVPKFFKKS
jgi:hypothetical protein